MKKYFNSSTWPLWLAFLLPFIILGSYFANRHMMPFGNSTILTVDLGQQYVDMFASFKDTIIKHPQTFFYSFSNALGGDMFGLFTYYLMSPLNLILLFFNPVNLPSGILLLTLLKYSLSSLSMVYAIKKTTNQNNWTTTSFGLMYALSGWMVAYQLNLLWLDALILLPLIIVGLDNLLKRGKYKHYVIPLVLILCINYYMGYMICIFLVLYFLFAITKEKLSKKELLTKIKRFTLGSLLSCGISAFILLPTFFQLTLSKGQYTTTHLGKWIEYNPLLMINKLFVGSFNFEQMPSGQPNIFITSLGLFCTLLYFTNKDVRLLNKLATGIISLFLIISMFLSPLDVFWHGMQFPVWYPYRFSFIWCFWIVWLASTNLPISKRISLKTLLYLFTFLLMSVLIAFLTMSKTNFMTYSQVIVGLIFSLFSLVLLSMPRISIWKWLVLLLTITEASTNVIWTLNNFSYLTKEEYQTQVKATNKALLTLPANTDSFYRVGQTYARTKDDPFMHDYFGGSSFTSSFSRQTSLFMGAIGNPSGDNYSAYNNGTLLTDNLLGFKYYLDASNHVSFKKGAPSQMSKTQRPDLMKKSFYTETPNVTVYKNNNVLPIGFAASKDILTTKINDNDDPIYTQSKLFGDLVGQNDFDLFTQINFDSFSTSNVNKPLNVNGAFLTPKNSIKPATLTTTFVPTTNNSYYLTIGSSMIPDNLSIFLNGKQLNTNDSFRNTIILNIASNAKNQPQTIVFKLKKQSLWLQNVKLYELNNEKLTKQTKYLNNNPFKINHFTQRYFNGTVITTKNKPILMTTIPQAPGWKATIDSKVVKTDTVANMFLAVKLPIGTHKVTLKYTPPLLYLGLLITLFSLLISTVYYFLTKKRI